MRNVIKRDLMTALRRMKRFLSCIDSSDDTSKSASVYLGRVKDMTCLSSVLGLFITLTQYRQHGRYQQTAATKVNITLVWTWFDTYDTI